jgi:phosphatidate cytidylyltransferase
VSELHRFPPATAFGSRILFAGMLVAVFGGLAWADWVRLGGTAPSWWLLPLAAALAVGGIDELVALFAGRGVDLPGWVLRPAVVATVLSAALAGGGVPGAVARATAGTAAPWPAAAVALTVVALGGVEIARYRTADGPLERLCAGTFCVAFVGLPLAFMVSLRLLHAGLPATRETGGGDVGVLPLVSLVAVVKAGDIAAYAVGSLIGRHRLAPVLSPGKTWEGAAASLVGAVVAAWFVLGRCQAAGLAGPWGGWLVYGTAVGLAGMAGDLAESLVKRACHAKDSGRSLGGLGGVLDLVDSLLFAAPVAWLLWVAGGR